MSTDRAGPRADHGDGVPRPADVRACATLGCPRTDDLRPVDDGTGDVRVLCPRHEKYHLEVSS